MADTEKLDSEKTELPQPEDESVELAEEDLENVAGGLARPDASN